MKGGLCVAIGLAHLCLPLVAIALFHRVGPGIGTRAGEPSPLRPFASGDVVTIALLPIGGGLAGVRTERA